mmetsp:Transcript_56202/g.171180  ORF Transcript_56202/g.171180 Transcript_56202/m.171180 type:complete len:283 (+) Transcript_56202:3001-3849(+)
MHTRIGWCRAGVPSLVISLMRTRNIFPTCPTSGGWSSTEALAAPVSATMTPVVRVCADALWDSSDAVHAPARAAELLRSGKKSGARTLSLRTLPDRSEKVNLISAGWWSTCFHVSFRNLNLTMTKGCNCTSAGGLHRPNTSAIPFGPWKKMHTASSSIACDAERASGAERCLPASYTTNARIIAKLKPGTGHRCCKPVAGHRRLGKLPWMCASTSRGGTPLKCCSCMPTGKDVGWGARTLKSYAGRKHRASLGTAADSTSSATSVNLNLMQPWPSMRLNKQA